MKQQFPINTNNKYDWNDYQTANCWILCKRFFLVLSHEMYVSNDSIFRRTLRWLRSPGKIIHPNDLKCTIELKMLAEWKMWTAWSVLCFERNQSKCKMCKPKYFTFCSNRPRTELPYTRILHVRSKRCRSHPHCWHGSTDTESKTFRVGVAFVLLCAVRIPYECQQPEERVQWKKQQQKQRRHQNETNNVNDVDCSTQTNALSGCLAKNAGNHQRNKHISYADEESFCYFSSII